MMTAATSGPSAKRAEKAGRVALQNEHEWLRLRKYCTCRNPVRLRRYLGVWLCKLCQRIEG